MFFNYISYKKFIFKRLVSFARTCFLIVEIFNFFCVNAWTSKYFKLIFAYFYKKAIFFQYNIKSLIDTSVSSKIALSVIFFSPLEQFDVIGFVWLPFLAPLFFNVLVPFLLVFGILTYVFTLNAQELKLIPGVFQRLFEMVIEFVFDLIKQQIGKDGYILFPFIFTLFNFVLFTIY